MIQMNLRHSNTAITQINTAFLNEERMCQNSGEVLIESLY